MRTVREIEQALFDWAPLEQAMEWDNVGHLLGDPESQVERILVALDITPDTAGEAIEKGCQLIVAHHPLMNCKWLPVQSIRTDQPQGRLFIRLLTGGVSAICMHTNLDAAGGGVNDVLAGTLGLRDIGPFTANQVGRCGLLDAPTDLPSFVRTVSHALCCNGVRYADAGRPVYQVAVGGGACGEFEDDAIAAGCDTFVTSDLSYHQFLEAKEKGINLIDAGHFPTENPVCAEIVSYLTDRFPEITVMQSTSHREVIQYYVEGE